MSKTRRYRRLVLQLVSGIMTVCLCCLTLSIAVLIQFGVEKIALNHMTDEIYYKPQWETLYERVCDLTEQCGLPEAIVDDVFDSEEILAFTKEYTVNCIKGFDSELHTAPVEERLKANLYHYMDAQGMDKAILDMDALDNYLTQAASVYEQTLNNGFVLHYHSLRESLIPPAIAGAAVTFVMIVLCYLFMYKVTGMRRKMLSYSIRAYISTAVLCMAAAVWRFVLHGDTGITYTPRYMERLCHSFEDYFFLQLAAGALLWIAAAVISSLMMYRIRHSKKER